LCSILLVAKMIKTCSILKRLINNKIYEWMASRTNCYIDKEKAVFILYLSEIGT
jgi:hypothetical protein